MGDIAQLKYSLGIEKKPFVFQSPYQAFTGTKMEQLQRGAGRTEGVLSLMDQWLGNIGKGVMKLVQGSQPLFCLAK